MKITLAIGTFNREKIVKICSRNLEENLLENINVRVYDDSSSEYDEKELKKIFPYAKEIKRRVIQLKADKNMYTIYKDFLETNDNFLVQLDSDMIVGENFFNMVVSICNELRLEEGVYSLYNSINHSFINDVETKKIGNEIFKRKKHIGAACVIFSRNIIKKIIENIEITSEDYSAFDWRWSKYLYENNIPIYVSQNSYVQHIGLGGQNNNSIKDLDIGTNFIGINNLKEANFLIQYYEEILMKQRKFIENISFIEYLKIKHRENIYLQKFYKLLVKRKK